MKKMIDSHRSLMLLDEISKGDDITQRDLSVRLGMAVGLVNTYLKNLGAKGYIKIKAIPPKRFRYYLTPKGFIEKSRLTYDMLQNYTRVFSETRREFSELCGRLRLSGVKKVYFAGIDEVAEIAYLSLREADMELVGDIDSERAGQDFFKTKITSFDEVDPDMPEHIIITSFNKRDEVRAMLLKAGARPQLIHSVY